MWGHSIVGPPAVLNFVFEIFLCIKITNQFFSESFSFQDFSAINRWGSFLGYWIFLWHFVRAIVIQNLSVVINLYSGRKTFVFFLKLNLTMQDQFLCRVSLKLEHYILICHSDIAFIAIFLPSYKLFEDKCFQIAAFIFLYHLLKDMIQQQKLFQACQLVNQCTSCHFLQHCAI